MISVLHLIKHILVHDFSFTIICLELLFKLKIKRNIKTAKSENPFLYNPLRKYHGSPTGVAEPVQRDSGAGGQTSGH